MDTPTMLFAAIVAAANPHIETAPAPLGLGDDEIVGCNYNIDGVVFNKYVPVESRPDGVVCVIPVTAITKDGAHLVRARYVKMQGVGPFSEWSGFTRRSIGNSVAWTWTGTVVCDPDCVSK